MRLVPASPAPSAASSTITTDGTSYYARNSAGAITSVGTDATTVIQSALTALPSTGGMVSVGAGTFTITAALTYNVSDVMLCGVGWASKIVMQNGTASHVMLQANTTVNNDGTVRLARSIVRDLYFDANYAWAGTIGGSATLSFLNIDHLIVENVYTKNNPAAGIQAQNCVDVKIVQCVVDGVANTVNGNRINVLDSSSTAFTSYQSYGNVHLAGNYVKGAPQRGIYIPGVSARATVVNNTVRGIGVGGDDTARGVSGITFEIGTTNGGTVAISDNVVDGMTNFGIGIADSSGVVPAGSRVSITGNTVRDCLVGLNVTDRAVVATGNVLSDVNTGIACSSGKDCPEEDYVLTGNLISLRPGATGRGIDVVKNPATATSKLRNLLITGNLLDGDPAPDNPGLLSGPTSGGAVDAGTHVYALTNVTATGETRPSAITGAITTTGPNGTVTLSRIPIGPQGVTSRKLYRSAAGTTTPLLLLATIADNTTTTYVDVIADASLGAAAPTVSALGSADGIQINGNMQYVDIAHNTIRRMGQNGILTTHSSVACTDVSMQSNRIYDCGAAAVANQRNGIAVQGASSNMTLRGNTIIDSGVATMLFGINFRTAAVTNAVIEDNDISGMGTGNANIFAGTTGRIRKSGTVVVTDGASYTPDVFAGDVFYWTILANAARTINLPTNLAATSGTRITFIIKNGIGGATAFTAANLTVNAGFLKNGAFPATNIADTKTRVFRAVYNGTNWIEEGRVDADL